MYDWQSIPDEIPTLKEGFQILTIFDAWKTVNVNDKYYLHVKASLPEIVDEAIAKNNYDENGRLKAYPQASINIYYETDFGMRILKNLLKAAFGEENLKHLQDIGIIVDALEKKKPRIKVELRKNGDYVNIKEMTATSISATSPTKQEPTPEDKANQLVRPARERLKTKAGETTREQTAAEAQAEAQANESDDLPF